MQKKYILYRRCQKSAKCKKCYSWSRLYFSCTALKQVPSCEFYPMEAVKTNVIGTDNILRAIMEEGVKRVVCLSTDKAAYQINAMGTIKAMMEKVILQMLEYMINLQ